MNYSGSCDRERVVRCAFYILFAFTSLTSALLAAETPRLTAWREKMQPLVPLSYIARHIVLSGSIERRRRTL